MLPPSSVNLATDSDAKRRLDRWDVDHSWHPFTQMQEYSALPQLQVERGKGCWLYDVEGNRYLDGNASIWTNVHGHNDPDLNQALRDQLDKVAHSTYLGLSHPAAAELSRKLVELAPQPLERVFFSDNGSNAIEIALKLSFQYWQLTNEPQRRLVVGMSGAYHGDTFGAMAVGDSGAFHGRFAPWTFETRTFKSPLDAGEAGRPSAEKSLVSLRMILDQEGHQIASVIIEPLAQGAAGMRFQPPGFVKDVERLCRQAGVHLILDEVFVGFGRMGSMLACQQETVAPDFLCLAKGLTAGYLPLAATLTSDQIYSQFLGTFDSGRAFIHGHTFTANPLACVVALKSIEKLESMISSGRLASTIDYFGERLRETFSGHPNVKAIRQHCLAAAIDLFPGTDSKDTWSLNDRKGMAVCIEARKHGILLRPLMDSLLIVPPLIISNEEIDFLLDNTKAAIDVTL